MSYFNLKSNSVKVFPSTRRGSDSRRMSESAIAGIINKLVDRPNGFVITPKENESLNNSFEFNVYGYYFYVDSMSKIVEAVTESVEGVKKIYANIVLQTTNGYIELMDSDMPPIIDEESAEDSYYIGLKLTADEPWESDSQYRVVKYLLILELDDNGTWVVPSDSRIKFNWDSLDIDINGGIIL